MFKASRLRSTATGERGGVLVMVALYVPVAILLVAFVVDVGNWFDHKRHLQLQADAGALATARAFNGCFAGSAPNMDAADAFIYQFAGQYGGSGTVYTPPSGATKNGPSFPYPSSSGLTVASPIYNTPVAATSPSNNDYELVNSQTYANQSSPVDSGVPSSGADPCNAAMTDVKLTETNLPWYLQALNVPFINAHARVSILEETSQAGALPVAAVAPVPQAASISFVDEASGTVLNACGASGTSPCTAPLTQDSSGSWSNTSAALPLNVQTAGIGVRIALSGDPTTTTCGQPKVVCYDSSNSNLGILHIEGWSGNGTGGDGGSGHPAPLARDVTLTPDLANASACSDAHYSSGTSVGNSYCTVGVKAKVNFGTTGAPPAGAEVDAVVNGTCYALGYQSTTGTDETWSSTANAPSGANCTTTSQYPQLAVNAGPVAVDLQVWDTALGSKGKTPNFKTFSAIQRAYTSSPTATANAVADPIQSATLTEGGSEIDNAQVCETGHTTCTHNLVVTLGLSGQLKDNTGQLVSLRISGGSQSQELNCGGGNIRTQLQFGCSNTFAINTSAGLSCAPATTPPQCVPVQTGEAIGQVSQGLNARFAYTGLGNCNGVYPNNTVKGVWSGQPDPRIVQVFVTPFDSFSGSGNGLVPVINFATMYVAGWSGDPCPTDPPDPAGGNKGDLWGYFVYYVNTLGTGTGGSKCTTGTFGTCVAVLTQ